MIAQIASMGHIQTRKIPPKINIQNRVTRGAGSTVPFFERNTFLREEVTAKELSYMHDIGYVKMTSEDLIETKTALNVIGYNPATKLINSLIENQVLGYSRPGIDNHPHLNFFTSLLPRLKKEAGATHLALALPKSLQKLLDVFTVTGEILPSLSPVNLADFGLKGQNDFIELLKAARLAGYVLIAIEPNQPVQAFDPERERTMASYIQRILKSQENAKVVFLAPDRHLGYMNVGDWTPVAGILQEAGVKVCTVNQYWNSDFMPKVFACLMRGLTRPVALASKDVKMFAALQSRSLQLENILPNNWDMTIIYPKTILGRQKFIRQQFSEMRALISKAFSLISQR